MKVYKLTDRKYQTYGGCQWGVNITHTTDGTGDLCSPGWIHAYTDPLLAVLLNPIHANIVDPVLWEAEGDVGKTDHGLKVGCTILTTIRKIPLPAMSMEHRVRFGILCAMCVYKNVGFTAWATKWLDGSDRSRSAAEEAARAAEARASAARAPAAWLAVRASAAAARAAEEAARAAEEAARAAAWSAASDVDLIAIAHEASMV